ncbi:HNH endonuclease [Bdellovibrio sp. HCB2-146]|uniref:HNH endonuclease n=1 Tax=Bdellovibrio sp. HCB2-146 TaxID=3394362 RepID=UPI0039BD87AC
MENLKSVSNSDLISRMEKLVRTERKITHLVLLHIAEIEERRIYAELGFDGMYTYLTRGLGYSEGAAYRRLQSARLLKQVPSVAAKIEDGSLNLTQLTQVQKCVSESIKNGAAISQTQTLQVLEKLENKNSFETQKTLAIEMDLPVQTHDKIKPQQDDSVRIEVTLTAEQFAELQQAQSLMSHSCPNGSWADVISALAANFNKKKLVGRSTQPVIATRVHSQKSEKHKNRREYISVHTKRFLLNKAQHCCEYENPQTGHKCGTKFQLQTDHIQAVALGGTNEIGNLRVYCRTHNLMAAEKAGLKKKKRQLI